jgi:hypothetical protein
MRHTYHDSKMVGFSKSGLLATAKNFLGCFGLDVAEGMARGMIEETEAVRDCKEVVDWLVV